MRKLQPALRQRAALQKTWELAGFFKEKGPISTASASDLRAIFGAVFTKIKPFFTCFRLGLRAILPPTELRKSRRRNNNLCVQQSFLFPQRGCWLPSAMRFWRMPDTGSYQCLQLKQHSRSE